jgi:hypothetical protein
MVKCTTYAVHVSLQQSAIKTHHGLQKGSILYNLQSYGQVYSTIADAAETLKTKMALPARRQIH